MILLALALSGILPEPITDLSSDVAQVGAALSMVVLAFAFIIWLARVVLLAPILPVFREILTRLYRVERKQAKLGRHVGLVFDPEDDDPPDDIEDLLKPPPRLRGFFRSGGKQ